MLRAARDRTDAHIAHADALALPIRDHSAEAVLMAFVLLHLNDPRRGRTEAHRVLRTGGTVGTVTWKSEATLPVDTIWTETPTDKVAPPLPARRVDTAFDSTDAMTELLADTSFHPRRVWIEALQYQCTPDTYGQLVTGSVLNRLRLEAIDPDTRTETLAHARPRLESLQPEAFGWRGEVVCAVATR